MISRYSVEDHGGYPFLVPSLTDMRTEKDEQSSTVLLEDGPTARRSRDRCSIGGEPFSLTPGPRADAWVLGSLTAEAWARRSDALDMHSQWKVFVRRVAERQESGCFGDGVDLFSVERVLGARLAMPASEVLTYLYGDDKSGFVDLAPGMKLVIEWPPSAASASRASDGAARPRRLHFNVEANAAGGGMLRDRSKEVRNEDAAREETRLKIKTGFASSRLLRLFLRSQSEESRRSPMLLGSSDPAALERETDRVQAEGREACTTAPQPAGASVLCMSFPEASSVSLLMDVRINGRHREFPVGTQLGLLLEQLPSAEHEAVYASVRVERRSTDGTYAPVVFPRNNEGAVQVLLLPGDHVDWRSR